MANPVWQALKQWVGGDHLQAVDLDILVADIDYLANPPRARFSLNAPPQTVSDVGSDPPLYAGQPYGAPTQRWPLIWSPSIVGGDPWGMLQVGSGTGGANVLLPENGYYLIACTITWAGTASGAGARRLDTWVNGLSAIDSDIRTDSIANAGTLCVNRNMTVYPFAAKSTAYTIQTYVWQRSTTALNIASGSLSVIWVADL